MKFVSLEDFGGSDSSHSLFRSWGWQPTNIDDAEIIVFNGGTDIAPEIYGENAVYTSTRRMSNRDVHECALFNEYKGKKLLLGICRGSQLLNCLNGGKLWQDVNNHGRSHEMVDLRTGKSLEVTSTHHQMMRPNFKTAEIIGVACESTLKRAEREEIRPVDTFETRERLYNDALQGKNLQSDHLDMEVVWYRDTASLCIQGHPEYVPGSQFAEWSKALIMQCYNDVFVTA